MFAEMLVSEESFRELNRRRKSGRTGFVLFLKLSLTKV